MRWLKSLFWALIGALVWSACGSADTSSSAGAAFVSQSTEAVQQAAPPLLVYQSGATYYVRPDGGDAKQCNGLFDVPYPGSGTALPCAWDHPFRALPPGGQARVSGGSTVVIASGSYRMGVGAPGADDEAVCSSDYPWDCHMPPIPSGPDAAQPTRILGAGWDSGCTNPPELWGTERTAMVLNLTGTENAEIACLEITDHAGCADSHTGGLACEREGYPYGDWAEVGLYAEDSSNVDLRDLDIHGLAVVGVHTGRLTDWTVERVRVAANGWAGWDGDIDGDDLNAGTLTFRRWTVEWNGCVETYPGQVPTGCWAQTAGGYGDGVGTGSTGGDWVVEDSSFLHNTSDGLDLLYHELGGTITLRRVRAEGNAGNPVKITGEALVENSVLVANCAFFDGQPFTYNVDPCRALGNALEVTFTGGEQIEIVNNTVYGQGDGLLGAGAREGFSCSGAERIFGRSNLFLGGGDYLDPGDQSFLFYFEGCPGLQFDTDYSLYHNVKLSAYTPGPHDLAANPLLVGPLSGTAYGMELSAASPAVDAGDALRCPDDDYTGMPRSVPGTADTLCDIGAYEWRPDAAWLYLPFVAGIDATASPPSGTLLRPADLTYTGAFRLPGDEDRPRTFAYGGNAMTFNPDGDLDNGDAYPGSLFITGHDRLPYGELPDGDQVAEVSVPAPVITRNVEGLPCASFLQDFHDVAAGYFTSLEEIPKVGMQYLVHPDSGPLIHLCWGQHLQPQDQASHAWFSPDLERPDMTGAWFIGDQNLYSTNGYLFDIPAAWVDAHAAGRHLATGRMRDGGQGGMGPALFAYRPWQVGGAAPPAGTHLVATTLLLYENAYNTEAIVRSLNGYQHADEWEGGAWITTPSGKAAVLFAGTKGSGSKYWYGYINPAGSQFACVDTHVADFPTCRLADGSICPAEDFAGCCDESAGSCVSARGWWSTRFDAQFLLYDPADLARVAAGTLAPWEPQPYAVVDIDEYLYLEPPAWDESTLGWGVQRRNRVGAAAYDRQNGFLYVLELYADGGKPVVHVWQVE